MLKIRNQHRKCSNEALKFINPKYAQTKTCISKLGSRPLNKFNMIQQKVLNKKKQEKLEIQENQKKST